MESWFLILVSLSVAAFLKALLNLFLPSKHNLPLPPGPSNFPIIGPILWLRKSLLEVEAIIHSLNAKLGPIVTLHIGSRPAIFIADRSLAHQALIQHGAVFADRPPALPTQKILSCNQHNINSSCYGPTWRLLRRNLTAEILHPSRVKSYAHARKWVLQILQNRFELASKSGDPVRVVGHFQFAMFCLLVLMCFGSKLDEKQIEEIERVERQVILNMHHFGILISGQD